MHLGSWESTREAREALGFASCNSNASLVLSQLPKCIHNSIDARRPSSIRNLQKPYPFPNFSNKMFYTHFQTKLAEKTVVLGAAHTRRVNLRKSPPPPPTLHREPNKTSSVCPDYNMIIKCFTHLHSAPPLRP